MSQTRNMPLASTMARRAGLAHTQARPRTAPPLPGSARLLPDWAAISGSSNAITGVAVAISHTTTRPSLSPDASLSQHTGDAILQNYYNVAEIMTTLLLSLRKE